MTAQQEALALYQHREWAGTDPAVVGRSWKWETDTRVLLASTTSLRSCVARFGRMFGSTAASAPGFGSTGPSSGAFRSNADISFPVLVTRPTPRRTRPRRSASTGLGGQVQPRRHRIERAIMAERENPARG